jgi:hypothetical protein
MARRGVRRGWWYDDRPRHVRRRRSARRQRPRP